MAQHCCHRSGRVLCHVDTRCPATWCTFTQGCLVSEAPSAEKSEFSPVLSVDDASLLVS